MYDKALELVAPYATKTASYNTPSFQFNTRTTPFNLYWLHWQYRNANQASGSGTWEFDTQVSTDNNTFVTNFSGLSMSKGLLTLTTVNVGNELWTPILTDISVPFYVRGALILGGAGVTPTIDIGVRVSWEGPYK